MKTSDCIEKTDGDSVTGKPALLSMASRGRLLVLQNVWFFKKVILLLALFIPFLQVYDLSC